jgi:hypothetical protein
MKRKSPQVMNALSLHYHYWMVIYGAAMIFLQACVSGQLLMERKPISPEVIQSYQIKLKVYLLFHGL